MPDQKPDSIYGVICRVHGPQGLGEEDYTRQLEDASCPWICPICGMIAEFDELRLEEGS